MLDIALYGHRHTVHYNAVLMVLFCAIISVSACTIRVATVTWL